VCISWHTDPSRKLRWKSGGGGGGGGDGDDDDDGANKFFSTSRGHGFRFGCHAHCETKQLM